MKIVGSFSNDDEIGEFENIVKVFVLEQRMENLDYKRENKTVNKETYPESPKQIPICPTRIQRYLPFFTVKGLN